MTEPVDEILAQWFPVQVLAVRIDIFESDLLEAGKLASPADHHTGLDGRQRRVLSAKHDLVNLALTGREMAARGQRAGDVAGVTAVGSRHVHHHHVAVLHLLGVRVVVQDS